MGSSQTGAGLLHMRGRVQRMRWGKAVSSGCLCWRGGKSIAVCRHGGRAGQGMLTNQSTGGWAGARKRRRSKTGGSQPGNGHVIKMALWLAKRGPRGGGRARQLG